jgi:hypothetical protein
LVISPTRSSRRGVKPEVFTKLMQSTVIYKMSGNGRESGDFAFYEF